MEIVKRTTLIDKITKIINPVIKKLFSTNSKKASEEISMNIIANILGLGNAATPLGLKAMKTLQEENKTKDILSDSMMILILINTASIQLIPTTVIAIRMSQNSQEPTKIIFAVWLSTVIAATVGIFSCKLLIKYGRKGNKNE